jgi:uncharacterized repeat protein (TIGR02543 family)
VERMDNRGCRSRRRRVIFALLLVVLMAFCATTAYATTITTEPPPTTTTEPPAYTVYYYVVQDDYGNTLPGWIPSKTISELKTSIAGDHAVHIPAGEMVLVYKGTVLQDAKPLSYYSYVSMDTIRVYRTSDYYDADLSSLTVSSGTLTPAFSSGVRSYSVTVPFSVNSLIVGATSSNPGAGIVISGSSLSTSAVIGSGTGSASRTVSLAVGSNVVTAVVTPLGGSPQKTYTVTITRLAEEATVTFDSQGGSAVASATVDVGTAIAEPAPPTRSGYTFGGWHFDEAGTLPVTFPYTVAADIVLYAKWTPARELCTVTFDSQGGSAVAPVTVDVGTAVAEPTPPTRTGYTFKGWHFDEAGTLNVSFPYTATGDVILYAQWAPSLSLTSSDEDGTIYVNGRFTLTPNLSGGTWTFDPAYLSRSGYDFTGRKNGTVQITYTLQGTSVTYEVTIRGVLLPATGQDLTLVYILACLSGATMIAAFSWRMRRPRRTV